MRASGARSDARLFGAGGYFTPDRKARFIAPEAPALRLPATEEFPLRLNTGRLRDQWHSMTRTGLSPSLGAHRAEPFVAVNRYDAAQYKLVHEGFARLSTGHGACVLKVVVSADQQRGSVFAPIHWSDQTASSARVGDMVAPETDPHSGQPEAKATPAAIGPIAFAARGFALSRRRLVLPPDTWWARVAVAGAWGYLLATDRAPPQWHDFALESLAEEAVITEYIDRARGIYRVAAFVNGSLDSCLFVGRDEIASQWQAARRLFEAEAGGHKARHPQLAGFAGAPHVQAGSLVCACFDVGLEAIRDAITSWAAASVEEVGLALRAGTKCGTCLPELRSIVADERLAHAY